MIRQTLAAMTSALTISLFMGLPSAVFAAPDDADREIAVKALNAGAAMFDAKDAKGLAATYSDDAVLKMISRDIGSGGLKIETKHGRAEVEEAYRELFKGDTVYHAKNTVEFVRKVGPDVLIITGYFEPDSQATDSMKIPFVQVRHKQGDVWKITDIQVFVIFK